MYTSNFGFGYLSIFWSFIFQIFDFAQDDILCFAQDDIPFLPLIILKFKILLFLHRNEAQLQKNIKQR